MSCSQTLEFCVNHSFLLDSGKPSIFDDKFVHKIKSIKPQLDFFLSYYKKYSESDIAAFKKLDYSVHVKEFVVKLSTFLNLSIDISHALLSNYFGVCENANENDLELMFKRGYDSFSLMQSIRKYYHKERMSLIMIIRYVFCDRKDEWQIIANIIQSLIGHKDRYTLFCKILKCYEDEFSARTLCRLTEYSSDEECTLYFLEEQAALIETLLLASYSMKDNNVNNILSETLRVFQGSNLTSSSMPLSRFISSRTAVTIKNIVERICFLQGLLLVSTARLSCETTQSQNTIKEDIVALTSLASKTCSQRCDGVLLLMTSLMNTTMGININNSASTNKMAEIAIVNMKLFSYISTVVSSQQYKISPLRCSQLELAIHCIIFDLVSFMCHHVHINSFTNQSIRQDLVTLMCEIIRPINLYSDIKFLKTGFSTMLEDLSLSFPMNLDMLKVVSSMMSSRQTDVVGLLSDFLGNLSWFCDRKSAVEGGVGCAYIEIVDDDGDGDTNCAKSCLLTRQYRPYRTKNTVLTLEQGQEGFVMEDSVVWAVHYSVWDIVSAEVELTHMKLLYIVNINEEMIDNDNHNLSLLTQFQRLEIILDFLIACVKSDLQRDFAITVLCQLLYLVDSEHFLVDGCEMSLVKLIDLMTQVLTVSSDQELIGNLVAVKHIFPTSHSAADRLVYNDSVVSKAWQSLSIPSNFAIVQAYLNFSLALINSEKCMQGDVGVIAPSVIFGSIVFVSTNLLVEFTQLHLSDVADIAINGLNFLNEILSLEPSLYSELSAIRRQRLELIQRVTFDVISHCPATVRTLLLLSSVDVDTLMLHTNISSQMLTIEGNDQKLSKIVLLSLSVVKFLFTDIQCSSTILQILNSSPVNDRQKKSHNVTYIHQYVLSLLELLGYPYGAKIARMVLIILKLIVQKTSVSIVACLGEKTSKIKELLLTFISSRERDQVIRGLLFDFVAECVFVGRHGILQLLFGEENHDSENNVAYQSCLNVIDNYQPDDSVSMVLLVSVSKFLSSLWINDCQGNLILQNTKLWSSLYVPLKICMSKISSHEILDMLLYDYIGNVYGLLAMEVYSSEAIGLNNEVVKTLNDCLREGMVFNFLEVFEKTVLQNENLNQEVYLEKILSATTWWKTLVFISLDLKSQIVWLSIIEEFKLILKILSSVSNLVSMEIKDDSSVVINLADNLISCVVNIVNKRVKLLTREQADEILERLISLLTDMLATSSLQTHRCQADLLASCSLILLEHSVNPDLLHKSSLLTHDFITILSIKLSVNSIDTKILINAITANMATDKDSRGSHSWVTDLSNNGTLVNCMSLLHDRVKAGDLSLLTQTLLTFLIRISKTQIGSSRILQSSLLSIIELDISLCDSDHDIVAYLTLMTQLILTLLQKSGQSAHALTFRFVSAHWERIERMIITACASMALERSTVESYDTTSKTLLVAASLFDLLWPLVSIRGVWPMFWSSSTVTSIMALVTRCINVMVAVLNEPHLTFLPEAAHIFRGTSRRMKHVSFSLISPKKKCNATFEDSTVSVSNIPLELASARLEGVVYRLIHSCILLYSRSTYLTSEENIYSGWEYSGVLLSTDFEEPKIESNNHSLSFGALFSLLTSTQSLLRDNLSPLTIGKEKFHFDGELLRQTHEITLGIIVSHSIAYLTKLDQSHKTQRNNFILNMKTELNCYLDGLSKSRRRSVLSSNSPLSCGPKVTSTPYVVRSSSVGESLDSFCAAIDSFKKSLDCF